MTILTIWVTRCADAEVVVEVRSRLTVHDHGSAADGLWRWDAPVVLARGNGCAGRRCALHRLDVDTGYLALTSAVDAEASVRMTVYRFQAGRLLLDSVLMTPPLVDSLI